MCKLSRSAKAIINEYIEQLHVPEWWAILLLLPTRVEHVRIYKVHDKIYNITQNNYFGGGGGGANYAETGYSVLE